MARIDRLKQKLGNRRHWFAAGPGWADRRLIWLGVIVSLVLHAAWLSAPIAPGDRGLPHPRTQLDATQVTFRQATANSLPPELGRQTIRRPPETTRQDDKAPTALRQIIPLASLTERPVLQEAPKLDTPAIQLLRGSGYALLELTIDSSGKVASVAITRSQGTPEFAKLAAAAFADAHYQPGKLFGRAVDTRIRVELMLGALPAAAAAIAAPNGIPIREQPISD